MLDNSMETSWRVCRGVIQYSRHRLKGRREGGGGGVGGERGGEGEGVRGEKGQARLGWVSIAQHASFQNLEFA